MSEPVPPEILSRYAVPLALGVFSLLFIILSITLYIKSYHSSEPIRILSAEIGSAGESSASSLLTVDIEGAVGEPGVYRLPVGSRIEDAVAMAGGYTDDADPAALARSVNRAAKLTDGAKIVIPGRQDAGEASDPSALPNDTVNINTATSGQLDSLAGIGPVTAEKIIGGRPYQRIDELTERRIVGAAVFERIKDRLVL